MSEWEEVALSDIAAPTDNALATGPFGSSISARFFMDSGVPVIRGGNLSEDVGARLRDEGLVFVSPIKAAEFKRSTVHRGDLVFTCWGTVNQIGLIDDRAEYDEYVISNKQMKLTPDPTKVDSLFLYYLFSAPHMQRAIKSEAIGSSVPGFNLGQLRAIRVKLPALPEQRAIAGALGALDDKIDLNARMNRTLRALMSALWSQARLNGVIETPLSKMAEYVNGGAYTKGADGRGRPVIRIRELNGGVSAATPRSSIEPPLNQVARDGDLLFSWSGSLDVYRWHGEEAIINQHIFKVLPRTGYPQWLVHEALRKVMPTLQGIARDKATTMGHIQRSHLETVSVGVPQQGVEPLDRQIAPIYELMGWNSRESVTLSELRDKLLPELVLGGIRVKDLERAVEAAV